MLEDRAQRFESRLENLTCLMHEVVTVLFAETLTHRRRVVHVACEVTLHHVVHEVVAALLRGRRLEAHLVADPANEVCHVLQNRLRLSNYRHLDTFG